MTADSTENELKKPTQILSSLFPQTAPINSTEEERAREKAKKEKEEEKEEQKKAWKRMKYGQVYVVSIYVNDFGLILNFITNLLIS